MGKTSTIGTIRIGLLLNSKGVTSGATAANKSLDSVRNSALKSLNALEGIAKVKGITAAEAKLRQLDGTLDKLANKSKKTKSAFSSIFTGLGQFGLAVQGLKSASSILSTPLTLVNDLQQNTAAFEIFTGSADKAKKMISDINKLSANTSVGGGASIGQAAKTMLGFGVETEAVIPALTSLSEIAAGSEEKFQGLALVYSQVRAQGKLMGNDMYQFVNNGVGILDLLSKSTGKSVGELKASIEKGAISFDMVNEALVKATQEGGKYYGMNQKISSTLGGVWNQVTSQVTLAMTNISSKIVETFKVTEGLKYLNQFVSYVTSNFDSLYNKGVALFGTLRPYITKQFEIMSAYVQMFGGILFSVGDMAWAFGSTVVGAIGSVYTYLTGGLPTFQGFGDFVIGVMNAIEFSFLNWRDVLAYVGVSIASFVVTSSNQLDHFAATIIHYIAGGLGVAKDYFIGFAKFTGNMWGNLASNIVNVFSSLPDLISGNLGWEDVWTPLTDGFKMEIRNIEGMSSRVIGGIEKDLIDTQESLAQKLGTGYDKFLADKKNKTFLPTLPTIETPKIGLNPATGVAKGPEIAAKPPEIAAKASEKTMKETSPQFAGADLVGSKEARAALLRFRFGANAKDSSKEISKNTKEANNYLKSMDKKLKATTTEVSETVSFV